MEGTSAMLNASPFARKAGSEPWPIGWVANVSHVHDPPVRDERCPVRLSRPLCLNRRCRVGSHRSVGRRFRGASRPRAGVAPPAAREGQARPVKSEGERGVSIVLGCARISFSVAKVRSATSRLARFSRLRLREGCPASRQEQRALSGEEMPRAPARSKLRAAAKVSSTESRIAPASTQGAFGSTLVRAVHAVRARPIFDPSAHVFVSSFRRAGAGGGG